MRTILCTLSLPEGPAPFRRCSFLRLQEVQPLSRDTQRNDDAGDDDAGGAGDGDDDRGDGGGGGGADGDGDGDDGGHGDDTQLILC